MVKVGLTGGIATGKSTVGEMFARRGAHVIHADRIAHDLMSPGQDVYEEVVARFGRGILQSDGAIDRRALASLAFPDRIQELNRIVHPAVIAFQDRWMEELATRAPSSVAIVEAALLYEAHADTHFDKIIVVTTPPEAKVERFSRRMKVSMEEARLEVERRAAAQIPDAEKARRADYVIDNSGTPEQTEVQVEEVWKTLSRLTIKA